MIADFDVVVDDFDVAAVAVFDVIVVADFNAVVDVVTFLLLIIFLSEKVGIEEK